MAPYQSLLYIGGEFQSAVSKKTFSTINPTTGEKICEIAEADVADVDKAVAAAREAFENSEWSRMSGAQRGLLLNKFADMLEQNSEELGRMEATDNGKPAVQAKAVDMTAAVRCFRYYAGWADKVHGSSIPTEDTLCYTIRQPVGVVGAIIPWNFPLLMFAAKVAPALACGCTIVVKAAEQTPLTALKAAELSVQAGIPKGVLNVLAGYGETAGAALARHPDVDKVSFTGSTEVGRKIMIAAAETNMKRVSLELGGKSAAIVCADADIDQAVNVEGAHMALFFNMGQCCTAGSRTFVHESIYDQFVEKSVARAKLITVGDPFEPSTFQGPQIDETQLKKIIGLCESGKRAGAKCVLGGERMSERKGFYMQPTIFSDVTDDMQIAKEEIFGPVMCILKSSTLDEVLKRANSSEYGLAAGIWSKDVDTINILSRGLQAGSVWVNCYNKMTAQTPFGRFKASGIGREYGEAGLDLYTETKCVQIQLPTQSGPM